MIANLYCEINNQLADGLEKVLEFSVAEKNCYSTGKVVPANQGNVLLQYKVVV